MERQILVEKENKESITPCTRDSSNFNSASAKAQALKATSPKTFSSERRRNFDPFKNC